MLALTCGDSLSEQDYTAECPVIARDDGTPDFHALRSKRRGREALLFAFDLIEHDGNDLRDLPLLERKRRLARPRQGQAAIHPGSLNI